MPFKCHYALDDGQIWPQTLQNLVYKILNLLNLGMRQKWWYSETLQKECVCNAWSYWFYDLSIFLITKIQSMNLASEFFLYFL